MKLNELLEVDWDVVAVVEVLLGDDARRKTFKRCEVDFIAFDEGFEVI